MESQVVLITGSSRGIGRLTALELSRRGHRVYATMRNPEPIENVHVERLDVTDEKSIAEAVSNLIEKEGRLDCVINNAGYGLLSPVDTATDDEIMKQFDVNLFGVIRVIREVLPQMRKQKSGKIINISSVVGVVSNPAMGWYSATKHALEAVSASLASTVFPWNIYVSVVQPGSTATEFAANLKLEEGGGNSPYGDFSKKHQERMKNILTDGQPPEEVAELIADVVEDPKPHFRYQTSERAKQIVSQFVVDPSGDQWLNQQKETFKGWINT
ncbi:Estradiol 17-beta-dehydrogenase 1 [Waddlia chondrophila 2032/99]|uniref:Estradiol 17-beta-dehydrogenase 1 n=2 Tax=Waddlia chondrophila TaxID=71667 RepID=F8LDB1_9BACT|nr:SDR family oxidoreductase [Waddlia chondrophila]ADI38305.1 putative short chain dehydrogenase/reductase family protein [Waddlia chondrophila WSU 86-1044]CCB91387.1 Estradiol 17-beta-dehydrogenase 1 [Waddlia chondrophila 2032/99]